MRPVAEVHLPTAREIAPLGANSLMWRKGFSRTGLLMAGRPLLMQVSHPVIGAGVRDFSDFEDDPWGRLDRTLTSLFTQLFGGQQAIAEAQRLRELHRSIKGVGFRGERYSALNPEAYAWVHMSNADSALLFLDVLDRPLNLSQKRQLFAEWREVGLLLGVKDAHMPARYDDLRGYVDAMVDDQLEWNETAERVLRSLSLNGIDPPYEVIPKSVWRALKPLGRTVLHDVTVGSLPPALRAKAGIRWTHEDEARAARIARVVRGASRVTPARTLHYKAGYDAMRAANRFERTGRT